MEINKNELKKKELKSKIEDLRKRMSKKIEEKQNTLAPEVIKISQELDEVLNEYKELKED